MKYKSGDTLLFQQNSLNAGFYRDFLAEEFHIHRYEWESCGYPQELPPGKNSLHLPFYQTNTSQYCPLYALCTTGIVVHSSLRSTVRNSVKNMHFFIRNIYTWQGGITPCSVWIKHFRSQRKCGKI